MSGVFITDAAKIGQEKAEDVIANAQLTPNTIWMTTAQLQDPSMAGENGCVVFLLVVETLGHLYSGTDDAASHNRNKTASARSGQDFIEFGRRS
jgi:hypothetical protein